MKTNYPRHIGIAGFAGAGKDTCAHLLCGLYAIQTIDRFARPIYDMVNVFLASVGVEPRWDRPGWKDESVYEALSPRDLLISLGSYWGREMVHPSVWINAQERRLVTAQSPIIVADVRIDDEARMLRRHGGLILQVTRPGYGCGRHVMEQGISPDLIDVTVANDGSLADLSQRLAALADVIRC